MMPTRALRKTLGLPEAAALSFSVVAPTMAMAFNVTLAVGAAGSAAPLAFAISIPVLSIVALSFVAFSRRVAHAGSAYAFITLGFGPRVGFLAGWALMLTYLLYGTGTAAMIGNFIDAALADYGITVRGLWIGISAAAMPIAIYLAYREMRFAARLMFVLEAVSVFAIIGLGTLVLRSIARIGDLGLAPFVPDKSFGWSGVGFAMVFAVMSLAGFEGAATLGEETGNPQRAIPIAIFSTVILVGIFYVFASYFQVLGFGLGHMGALMKEAAPLNTLALKFASRDLAALLDIAAALSAFSCALGSLSAAARMLFALGRAGLAPRIGDVHKTHGTPGAAVLAIGVAMIAGILLCAPLVGPGNYYGAVATIGTLALILVYVGVTGAALVEGVRTHRGVLALLGAGGTMLLLWPLYNALYPVPDYPANLWPFAVVTYLLLGAGLLVVRPAPGQLVVVEGTSIEKADRRWDCRRIGGQAAPLGGSPPREWPES
jgi:amino acid transporter